MRAAPAIGAVMLIAASSASASATDADGQTDRPRARVEFIRTVSEPTPFTDNCGSAGEPFVDAEVEPHLSVNPTNPNHLLAGWQQDRYPNGGARSNLAAVSHNGGKSWHTSTLPGVSSCTGGEHLKASDPWTAIGADGTAYVSSFAVTDPDATGEELGEFDGDSIINRSRSGGAAWRPPSPIAEDDGTFWHEKAIIEADPHAAETLYAVWMRHLMPDPTHIVTTADVAVGFSRSDDGGGTWSESIALPPDLPGVNEVPAGLLTLAGTGVDTTLLAVGMTAPARIYFGGCSIYATRSDDGGETWGAPVLIAAPAFSGDMPPFFMSNEHLERVRAVPCLSSSAVSSDGTVYVAWFERTPVGDAPGGGRIMFARSADAGATWATGVVAESARLAFQPTIAAAGNGTVGVTYFDTADDEVGDEEFTTDLRFASSVDDGQTWEHIDVAGPFDLRTAPDAGGYMLGDYFGLVGLPDGFGALVALPAPIAVRGATDIFYARITLQGVG